jgi:hypothetical protein
MNTAGNEYPKRKRVRTRYYDYIFFLKMRFPVVKVTVRALEVTFKMRMFNENKTSRLEQKKN